MPCVDMDWREEYCTLSIAPSPIHNSRGSCSYCLAVTPQSHWLECWRSRSPSKTRDYMCFYSLSHLNASILFRLFFSFLFLPQLSWPCISCISCTGPKTPPHLYTMPSTASVISLPSWEQPLLTRGWENSSKEDRRSYSQKLHRLIVQRLPLLAFSSKHEHTYIIHDK